MNLEALFRAPRSKKLWDKLWVIKNDNNKREYLHDKIDDDGNGWKSRLSAPNIGIKLNRFKSEIKAIEDITLLDFIMEFQFIHNNIFRILFDKKFILYLGLSEICNWFR